MSVKTTTLVQVLRNHGVQAWVDIEGEIEASNTFIDEDGQETQEVVSIQPTVEAVVSFLGYDLPDQIGL